MLLYTYDTSGYTGEKINKHYPNVRYYTETGWGFYDECSVFTYGYSTEDEAINSMNAYFAFLDDVVES